MVIKGLQMPMYKFQNIYIVIYDQYVFLLKAHDLCFWKFHHKYSPFRFVGKVLYAPIMAFHDSVDNTESQSGTFPYRFSTIKRLKNLFTDFWFYPGTLVLYGYFHVFFLFPYQNPNTASDRGKINGV